MKIRALTPSILVAVGMTMHLNYAMADQAFKVFGEGNAGSSYQLDINIDGKQMTFTTTGNAALTPSDFVSDWKSAWDLAHPSDAGRFVDNGNGTFRLIGSSISVKVGAIGATSEVVNDPDGVPFNPTLLCISCVPAVSEWGLIVLALLLFTAGTVALGRKRLRAAA